MNCHFRRYCFYLAERLKMTVNELLSRMTSKEISEWMAYDRTNSQEWLDAYNREKELESFDPQLQAQQLKQLLGGSRKT